MIAVQVLDIDASIDAIVLFDDIPIDLQTEQLIAPNNKKIIHWHLNDKIQNQVGVIMHWRNSLFALRALKY